MGGGSKAIPERWLEYTSIGKQIPRTRITCFKVPLKKEICYSLPMSQRFTPDMLIKALPNLVAVIDVTNTPRYYDKQELLEYGIQHEKIRCPGHAVPPLGVVNQFQNVMDSFWNVAESSGKVIGVHCTHGVNRTGYLVCRYLIECRGFHPEEAIKLFGESRGHPIERPNYLNDLKALKSKDPSQRTSNHNRQPQPELQPRRVNAQNEWRQRNFSDERGHYQHARHSGNASNFRGNREIPAYAENRQNYGHALFPSMNPHRHNAYDSRASPSYDPSYPSQSRQPAPSTHQSWSHYNSRNPNRPPHPHHQPSDYNSYNKN